MTSTLLEPPAPRQRHQRRRGPRSTSLLAHGEPLVWLTGGSLILCLAMIFGLLGLVLYQGGITFWPGEVETFSMRDGRSLTGEVTETESVVPEPELFEGLSDAAREALERDGELGRSKLRTGNFDTTGTHYDWLDDHDMLSRETREWTFVVERMTWGRFHGDLEAFTVDGEDVTEDPAEAWSKLREELPHVLERREALHRLESEELDAVNERVNAVRKELRLSTQESGAEAPETIALTEELERVEAEVRPEYERLEREIDAMRTTNERFALRFSTSQGTDELVPLAQVVRAYPANRLSFGDRVRVYLSRWAEFLTAEPRESNSEGGVYPAIYGTVAMTLIMSLLVVPFGVLAALYLREYAKQGFIVSMVRIAVGNLAGVPSIVFGVFGLGFFCYWIGSGLDSTFYRADLPNPTFGKGGLLWASLTLALLTLPVVIVASEEALSAVPNSMREGSYACGATKWQTIRRIVLPRAMPGIMTGMILAIARGAGEVAPLMLVGAVKLAPELPINGEFPFVHPSYSFMHLGFHIYDVGFQSQNSEAARPMVYTTTLLLIGIVVALNLVAVWIRGRLRRKFQGSR